LVKETAQAASYEVPLRKETSRLLPLEKFTIKLTVNKTTHSIEQITAGLREPFKVALGLARITDLDLDVRFDPIVHDLSIVDDPGHATGTVRVVLFKMGDRAEYAWSDFRRVNPVGTPAAASRGKS
jgi:hypothetical protein